MYDILNRQLKSSAQLKFKLIKLKNRFRLMVPTQIHLQLNTYGVILASPVGQRTPGRTSGTFLQAAKSSGPADPWIAEIYACNLKEINYTENFSNFLPKYVITYLRQHHRRLAFSHLRH